MSRWKRILLILCMLTGTVLTVLPLLSSWAADRRAGIVTADYQSVTAKIGSRQAHEQLAQADLYNADIERGDYADMLWLTQDGMMGYLEIPAIDLVLPIYHGTDSAVLAKGVGHLPYTSLPVGGANTHAALSAHSGMAGARLFTDLPELRPGDIFTIHILNRVLTYEVVNIATVLPQETELLAIQPGADLCTLITCTPYGVNSHRLLVQGKRVIPQSGGTEMTAPVATPDTADDPSRRAVWMRKYLIYLLAGAWIGCAAGAAIIIKHRRRL